MQKPVRILLAEDDEDDRLFFREAVTKSEDPATLIEVEDGQMLIEHLQRTADFPDVIVLDMNMPYLNGIECLQQIRKDERLADLPVVILSTSGSDTDIKRSFQAGANSYIFKPTTISELQRIIKLLIHRDWKLPRLNVLNQAFVLNSTFKM